VISDLTWLDIESKSQVDCQCRWIYNGDRYLFSYLWLSGKKSEEFKISGLCCQIIFKYVIIFTESPRSRSIQVTKLRMPNKWHICKEGQAGNKNRHRRGLLVFSERPSLPSASSRPGCSILSWIVTRGRSYGFIRVSLGWFDYSKTCEEGQSNSGLFASKRSKTSHGACLSPLGAKSASTDFLKWF
jgi:hypothetical protein